VHFLHFIFQSAVPPMGQRLNFSVQACPTSAYPYVTGVTNHAQPYVTGVTNHAQPYVTGVTNHAHPYETDQQIMKSRQNIDPNLMTSILNIAPQNVDPQGRVELPPPYSELI